MSEFDRLVIPIASNYEKVFMYGGSGGGYAALYYAININAEPIVYSPRIRLDPICGLSITEELPALNHELLSGLKSQNKVHVFYDPFFKPDLSYVKERVLPCFPNAKCYESPFSGHGAFYLAEIGAVKNIVLSIVNGDIFYADNEKRKVSKIYHFYFAGYLFLKGKINSGIVVSIRGLRIKSDKKTKVDKVNIYNQLVKFLRRNGRHELEQYVNQEFCDCDWFFSNKNKYANK